MSLQLSPKSQRLRSRKVELTHQLIVFRVRQEWFALPIQVAQKVIPLGNLYGAGSEISLTLYQDREIPVLDVQQRLFGTKTPPLLSSQPSREQPLPGAVPSTSEVTKSEAAKSEAAKSEATDIPLPDRFLLLVQTATGSTIGFPLDSQPMLRRVPESAFTPLSDTYLTGGQVRCVQCLIVATPEQPPIFLLNLDQLLQAQPALPDAPNG